MPSKPKVPTATLAIVEETASGPRARHTIPVWATSDVDALAARAEEIRARYEAETGNAVVINTHATVAA